MGFNFPLFMSVTNCFTSSKIDKFSNYKFQKTGNEFGIWLLKFNFEKINCNTLQQLNFPKFSFRFKNSENKISIFDEVGKKFVVLKPEEWVRQHCVQYLMIEKKYQ